MELFKIFGTIALNSDGANKSIDNTTSKAQNLGKKLQDVGKGVADFGKGVTNVGKKVATGMTVLGGAVLGGATAVYKMAENTAKASDHIDKMSQKIGISRKAYQEFDFICSQSGTDVDNLRIGMKTLTNQMGKAMEGNKQATETFKKLGISVQDTEGNMKSQEDMLWETLDALQGVENQTERAALANKLLGRSGSDLMPLINGARGSIHDMKEQAHELGLVLSDETIDAGVVFTDTMDQLKRALERVAEGVGAELMPYVTEFADYVIEHLPQIREMISKASDVIGKVIEKVKQVVKWFNGLSDTSKGIVIAIGVMIAAIGPVLIVIGTFITLIGNAIAGIGGLITAFGTLSTIAGTIGVSVGTLIGIFSGVIAVIAAIVVAIGVCVAAFVRLWKTNEKFRLFMITSFNEVKQIVSEFASEFMSRFKELMPFFKKCTNVLGKAWDGFCAILAPLFMNEMKYLIAFLKSVFKVILGILDVFIGVFNGDWSRAWKGIKSIVTGVGDFIVGFIKFRILNPIKDVANVFLGWFGTSWSKIFSGIKNTTSNIFGGVVNTIKGAIDKIKGLFNFKWEFPKLKMPHFKIDGKFSLNPPSVPSLGVDWYAKGAVLKQPTVFGMNGNKAMVGGEAGSEAIAPIDTLQSYVSEAVASQNAEMVEVLSAMLKTMQDADKNLVSKMETALGNMEFKVDERNFARLVRRVV